jgi:hypothetical protein
MVIRTHELFLRIESVGDYNEAADNNDHSNEREYGSFLRVVDPAEAAKERTG